MANTAVQAIVGTFAVPTLAYIGSVDFPSASLGISVVTGVAAGTAGAPATVATFAVNPASVAGGGLINGAPWWLPTILTSTDHATTWQV